MRCDFETNTGPRRPRRMSRRGKLMRVHAWMACKITDMDVGACVLCVGVTTVNACGVLVQCMRGGLSAHYPEDAYGECRVCGGV